MSQHKLKITHSPPFRRIHYRALEVYLSRVYHLTGFSALKAAGVAHGLTPEYLIGTKIPPHLQAKARKIRAGSPCLNLNLVLTVLCADNHIPAGQYILDTHRKPDPIEMYKHLLQQTHDPIHPECVRFKERHRSDPRFRRKARIIDQSLIEWLKQEPSEEPGERPEHSRSDS